MSAAQLYNRAYATGSLIANFMANTKKTASSNRDEAFLSSRIDLLNNYWKSFFDTHMEISSVRSSDEKEHAAYFTENLFEFTEQKFSEHCSELRRMLTSLRETSNGRGASETPSENPSVKSDLQLPRLNIPEFSGLYTDWPEFRDIFQSIIGSHVGLTEARRLQYLKSCCRGDAASILSNIPITNANYRIAWDALIERYEHKRLIVYGHFRTFFALPAMTKGTATELKQLLDGTMFFIRALKSVDRPVESWDDWLVYLISHKLDQSLRKEWEAKIGDSSDLPEFVNFQKFLESQLRALEALESTKSLSKVNVRNSARVHLAINHIKCVLCRKDHPLAFCFNFKKKPAPWRYDFVVKEHLCFNCLKADHSISACPSDKRCQRCQQRHHTLIHRDSPREPDPSSSTERSAIQPSTSHPSGSSGNPASSSASSHTSACRHDESVLLPTACATIQGKDGRIATVKVLIDQGSQSAFITERLVQRLGLAKHRVHVPIVGIGGSTNGLSSGVAKFTLLSNVDNEFNLPINALVLNKLTANIPTHSLPNKYWPHLQGIPLANPKFNESSAIDVIVGADVYGCLIKEGLRRGSNTAPIAQNSALGWLVSGPTVDSSIMCNMIIPKIHNEDHLYDLVAQLRKFWEMEEPPLTKLAILSPEEQRCSDVFDVTHKRDGEGRYVVKLPLWPEFEKSLQLGDSRTSAIRRLLQMERRFKSDHTFGLRYKEFMQQYLDLGHMQLIPDEHLKADNTFYLPHHGVVKESSLTTKLRVVFNASLKTTNGYSLNDRLCNGPKLQLDLTLVLSRWRQFPVAFCADIVKMYRQVAVDNESANMQRIVWRSSPDQPIQDYWLQTVTYGTKPAAYLAIRSLIQLAEDEGHRYPLGAQFIRNCLYVDDFLAGAENVSSAMEAQSQLVNILKCGGFVLQKWSSNKSELLQQADSNPESRSMLINEAENEHGILGLLWCPRTDRLGFKVNLPQLSGTVTKRTVLSDASRLFDPLGWLTPVIVTAKIWFQQLWLLKLSWDDALPTQFIIKWLRYRNELPCLQEFSIPRWVFTQSERSYELHGFSDSSEMAYAAAVYLRIVQPNGEVKFSLIMGKSKVAPIKRISLPRLELQGAVLLTRLLCSILNVYSHHKIKIFTWTDSEVTLHWINNHASRWKTFVANRVSEIQTSLPNAEWRHIPSGDNPADCASRGVFPSEIQQQELWWKGPQWIYGSPDTWPRNLILPESDHVKREEKTSCTTLTTTRAAHGELLSSFSSLTRLCRITALCLRFVHNLRGKRKDKGVYGYLTYHEYLNALKLWVRIIQQNCFWQEFDDLKSKGLIHRRSPLSRLNPVLDTEGLLRVNGRLKFARLSDDIKHPIILPKNNHLTLLIISQAHQVTLHGGVQSTLNRIRRQFWIIDGRNQVSKKIRQCVTCIRHRGIVLQQQMAPLPVERTTPKRPFLHTGVDFAGPFPIKMAKGRGQRSTKGYICVFVCFVTKALHLEVANDLSTEAFLNCFKRFVARRGLCSDLYSDRGTNFIGANSELQSKLYQHNKERYSIASFLASQGTTWHFGPPSAPHHGGLWEAGVKSVKYHLKRCIGDTICTFEEMTTLLAQIEAVLNSRPLCRLTNDPEDPVPLTPGHFLIGEPLLSVPEPNLLESNVNRLTRWQLIERMHQQFWQRWSHEYLTELQQRTKWITPTPQLQIDDIVLIKDERTPPTKWPLARVIALHPGRDQLVRVVTLKTKNSTFKRPIAKLCILPVRDPNEEHH